jgi:hypothetical protein
VKSSGSRPRFAFFSVGIETILRTGKEVVRKMGWQVLPLLALLLALALILSIGTHVPVIAPFVYALF